MKFARGCILWGREYRKSLNQLFNDFGFRFAYMIIAVILLPVSLLLQQDKLFVWKKYIGLFPELVIEFSFPLPIQMWN